MKSLLYPVNWKEIACDIKAANRYTCQACQKQCRRPGEMYRGWEHELTVAHICQDYAAAAVQVAPLCLPCHLAYDAPHSWIARQRQMRARMELAGQLAIPL